MCVRYECLVEGCGGVFKDEHARSMHLSDKHKYPKGFDYDGMGKSAGHGWHGHRLPACHCLQ